MPALLDLLKNNKELGTSARFEDLLVIRSYINRKNLPFTLSQRKVEGGYILSLKEK